MPLIDLTERQEYQKAYYLLGPVKERRKQDRLHRYKVGKTYIDNLKADPCMDCGEKYSPCVMDFDHRDPSTKMYNVSGMAGNSVEGIQEEIDKCDLVCSNCHRKRTHNQD